VHRADEGICLRRAGCTCPACDNADKIEEVIQQRAIAETTSFDVATGGPEIGKQGNAEVGALSPQLKIEIDAEVEALAGGEHGGWSQWGSDAEDEDVGEQHTSFIAASGHPGAGEEGAPPIEKERGGSSVSTETAPDSLTKLLSSSSWKERVAGLNVLDAAVDVSKGNCAAKVAEGHEACNHFIESALDDSNMAVQERAIEVAHNLSCAPGWMPGPLASRCAALVIDKALSKSARCRSKGQSFVLAVAQQGDECGGAVLDCLCRAINHKQPKVAAAAAETLRLVLDVLSSECWQAAQAQLVSACLTLFQSTVSGVRAEAVAVAVKLVHAYGAQVRHRFSQVRSSQVKLLDQALAHLDMPGAISGAAASAPQKSSDGGAAAQVASAGQREEAAPGACLEHAGACTSPVRTTPKSVAEDEHLWDRVGPGWLEALLALSKWQDKVARLQVLAALVQGDGAGGEGGRLAAGDYECLVKALVHMVGEPVVLVRCAAVACIRTLAERLADGLRAHKNLCAAAILEAMKEQDKRLVQQCHAALRAMVPAVMSALDLADAAAPLLNASYPFSVKGKVEVLAALADALARGPALKHLDTVEMARLRGLGALLLDCSNDSSGQVRQAAEAAMAALLLAASTSGLPAAKIASLLQGTDSKKRVRLLSAAQARGASQATLQEELALQEEGFAAAAPGSTDALLQVELAANSAGEGAAGATPAAALTCSPARRSSTGGSALSASAPAAPWSTTAAVRTTPQRARAASAAPLDGTDAGALEQSGPSEPADDMAECDALAAIGAANPAELLARLGDATAPSSWKLRTQALAEIEAHVKGMAAAPEACKALPPLLARLLVCAKAETNAAVLSSVLRLAGLLFAEVVRAAQSEALSRPAGLACVHPWLGLAVDKLGSDDKVKAACTECLACAAQVLTPAEILGQLAAVAPNHRSPKLQAAALSTAERLVAEFDGCHLDMDAVMRFALKMLVASTNPLVKKAAIELLVALQRSIGTQVSEAVPGLVEKASLRRVIEEALAAAATAGDVDAPPPYKRPVLAPPRGSAQDSLPATRKMVNLAATLAPHAKMLMGSTGDDCHKRSWQDRLQAVEAMAAALHTARPLGLGQSAPFLDAR